ncbi:uncharacterized protein LOC117288950 [Asterias rubens]|uniref:uncharacterized protein LOC117288950 n=1 Tax=Asterias rubens TaxID=7604 RepID=UPI0014559E45|nr:uncharacterized protein LOC117288950 [Asterias rubens]
MNDIGINKFLGPLGLLQYAEIFQIKGYDVESDFCSLNTGDLDAMNITHAGHRETILQAATNYQPSEEFEVFQWLRDNGIDHYFGNFIRSNYTTLRQVSIMELTSEVLHELEVLLPGHRKRLKNAYLTVIALTTANYLLLFWQYIHYWQCEKMTGFTESVIGISS